MYSVPEASKSSEETEVGADADGRHAGIIVGLILSIDRRESAEAALETVSASEKVEGILESDELKSQGFVCKAS
jgi:hypothetical protein